jgi:nucleotide-binding universal stress UspA family protein
MMKIQKALVCVDLSDYSKITIDYALTLTGGLVTRLEVLNVINSRDVEAVRSASRYYPGQINVENYLKEAKADRYKRTHEMIKQYFSSDMTQVNILIRVGIPFKEILSTIKEEKVDLVIIGNKGRGNALGTLFGSNAEKVFRHSPVPVLSVRDRTQFSR